MNGWLIVAACLGADAAPGLRMYQTPIRLNTVPSYYGDADPITNVHERTHGANSELRQRHGGAAFYLGGGRFVWVSEPRGVTLGQIARRISKRGRIAHLYLEQSRHPITPQQTGPGSFFEGHERNPLFLFDELSAYTNGAQAAVHGYRGGFADRVTSALEMAHYAAVCWRSMPGDYRHRRELAQIWVLQARRLDRIATTARETGRNYEPEQDRWHAELRRELAALSPAAQPDRAPAAKRRATYRLVLPGQFSPSVGEKTRSSRILGANAIGFACGILAGNTPLTGTRRRKQPVFTTAIAWAMLG